MSDSGGWNDDRPVAVGGGLLGRTARNAVLLAIACVFLVQFLGDGADRWGQMREMPRPADTATAGAARLAQDLDEGRTLTVRAGPGGHFWVNAVVNGTKVRFVVDTGATSVMLTPQDAARLGLRPAGHEFGQRFQTANGVVRGAPVVLRSVRIGGLRRDDVAATVNEAPMTVSLLGMSFLKRLDSYEVNGDRLTFRW